MVIISPPIVTSENLIKFQKIRVKFQKITPIFQKISENFRKFQKITPI